MSTSIISQIAQEFAEQKALTSSADGLDVELLIALWKVNALEVLAYAMPRLGGDDLLMTYNLSST